MKIQTNGNNVKLWLSASDTYRWAHRAGSRWPCSTLSNKRLFAEFDDADLIDYTVNGKSGVDVDASEFNAIIADFTPSKPVSLDI